jgi:hypothetical protein
MYDVVADAQNKSTRTLIGIGIDESMVVGDRYREVN